MVHASFQWYLLVASDICTSLPVFNSTRLQVTSGIWFPLVVSADLQLSLLVLGGLCKSLLVSSSLCRSPAAFTGLVGVQCTSVVSAGLR